MCLVWIWPGQYYIRYVVIIMCPTSCYFAVIYKSSPVASWDSKVSFGCAFQKLTRSNRSSRDILLLSYE